MASTPSLTEASGPPEVTSEKEFGSVWGVHDNYIVTLTSTGEGGETFAISTSVDETLAINLSSQWAAPFENVVGETIDKVANRAGSKAQLGVAGARLAGNVFGATDKTRDSTMQVWQSSDFVQFTIPFTLVATKDPVKEVRDKVVSLLKLVAPSQWGPILRPPGPYLKDAATGGRVITLKIGKFITLSPCIVRDVQVQFDNVIGAAGIPLKAKVNVDIQSWYTSFTTQDIDKLFKIT